MSLPMATPDTDIDLWLNQQTDKSLRRFLTWASPRKLQVQPAE